MTKTFDPKCHELAGMFLGDEPDLHTPERINELAALIQNTIEDFIAYEGAMRDEAERGAIDHTTGQPA